MPSTGGAREISQESLDAIVVKLRTDSSKGLSSSEAERRLKEFGPNALSAGKNYGFAGILLKELREPMILLLVVVAAIYSVLGELRDSVVIVSIVFIVVFIESYNVNRAKRSITALRKLAAPHGMVYRDGILGKEMSRDIVPGDLLVVTAGDMVPADGRLVESSSLKIDESSLTGESFSVIKDAEIQPKSTELADLTNMLFSGTLVVQGTGKLIVTSTGKGTELGKISQLVEEAEEIQTPLGKTMSALTGVLASLAVAFSVLIPLIGYFEGKALDDMILTGLSMAFATVPEELPVLISITLAIGAYSLSKHNAVVKDLKAAETLGSVTVIATDKTGTLTENRMTVAHTYSGGKLIDSHEWNKDSFLEKTILATGTLMLDMGGATSHKDPMEVATFEHSNKIGMDIEKLRKRFKQIEEFSFENRIKLASYLYRTDHNTLVLYSSGAPEVILSRSTHFTDNNGETSLMNEKESERILHAIEEISSSGERTIAVASKNVSEYISDRNVLEQGFTFQGLISFMDPPRPEVPNAIKECKKAGIRVIMLTGDHPGTAKKIAGLIGIDNSGKVVTGKEIQDMNDEELSGLISTTSVFARITSEDKFRIVELLKKKGETVAVTGDGVNDSPALRTAEIGIAMGMKGTEVARQASDMILLDDNFATIVSAVHEGRKILYTLRKSVKYEISIKIALVLIFMIPLFLLIPFPFSPIQIIVMELMMDVAALGGFMYEREEKGIMLQSPSKSGRKFFDQSLVSITIISAVAIAFAVSFVYLYIYYETGVLIRAQTSAFLVWMISQIFLAHNLRTEREPVFVKGFLSNRVISIWAIIVLLSLVVITIIPDLQIVLQTAYLTYTDWILIISASLASTFWMEAYKVFRYFRKGYGVVLN